ncbi:MAG: glycerol-3-phosphate 1-O-acyltransferase PlsY [Clostridia bacterium]|nr:glycerol-3-phosphate 1-O-acyltransferase PlsY [Clostridia bacterium]
MSAVNIIIAIGVIVFAYLIGSLNFAVIFSKVFTGKDIRQVGSGNAGATNMLRMAGKLPAGLTFLCDALKGFVACFAGKTVFEYLFAAPEGAQVLFTPIYGAYICCIAVMVGHIFPIFFGFKGGKAVACSVGTFAVCCPIAIILGLTGFIICFIISRIVSLSSLLATVIVVGVSVADALIATNTAYSPWPVVIMALLAGFIVFIKHTENLKRLAKGEEKKLSLKKEG